MDQQDYRRLLEDELCPDGFKRGDSEVVPAPVRWEVHGGAALFTVDFNDGAVSMTGVMRAPLCVVNERRQQMAGLCQVHLQVQPERAVFQCARVVAWGTPSVTDPLE